MRPIERADREPMELDIPQRSQIMADKEESRRLRDLRYTSPLTGDLGGLKKYYVGKYRIVAVISDRELIIVVIEIGHRRNVYDGI